MYGNEFAVLLRSARLSSALYAVDQKFQRKLFKKKLPFSKSITHI